MRILPFRGWGDWVAVALGVFISACAVNAAWVPALIGLIAAMVFLLGMEWGIREARR